MRQLTYVIESDYIDQFREMVSDSLLSMYLKEEYDCGYSTGMWVSEYLPKEMAKKIDKSFSQLLNGNAKMLDNQYIEDENGNYYDSI